MRKGRTVRVVGGGRNRPDRGQGASGRNLMERVLRLGNAAKDALNASGEK